MSRPGTVFQAAVIGLALALALLKPLPAPAADPFEIDVILPMTGYGGFIGLGTAQGLTAAEAVINKSGGINGQPVKFVVHDDQSSAQVEVQLTNGIIAQHKAVLIAGAFASLCNAISPLTKTGPVLYCLSPSVHPADGSFLYSIDPANAEQVLVEIRYLRLHGLKRLAMITSTDASGQDSDRAVDATLGRPENKELTLVDREHFAGNDISVAAQIARVKASNAQAFLVFTSGTPFGTVLRDAANGGLNLPVATTNSNMVLAQMTSYAQFMPPVVYFPSVACVVPPAQIGDARLRAAVEEYNTTLRSQGAIPEFMQSATYDPALLFAAALRKFGTKATPDQIRSFIANTRGFYGAAGYYDFPAHPQRGLGPSSTYMVRWDALKSGWSAVSKPGGQPL